ncbi:Uncharacterized protein APZ42_021201 [Daphnia magna]|uniref:Uncharacterized protein n=1 Tax=Daphnia magna TaxID=35525 RepID=A0A164X2N4_9CRUS|nr:Uncharacterized protein APZ42_021201 [Daphnia magna]
MPRRRNSEISHSNRAAVHKQEKDRRKAVACLRRQAVAALDATAINPARRAAAVQQGEEIFRAILAQRPVAPDGPIPPEARAVPTLVTLLLLLFSTNAFQITTCDCNKPSGVGLLQFPNPTCHTTSYYRPVTIAGTIAMETTAVECDIMRQSRRCKESPMMKSENKWIFNQEPEDEGYWLRTTTVVTVNCMLEEVVLSRIDEGDMINTPLGKAYVSHGSLSHNHLTLFWIDTYGKPTDIAIRQLEKGVRFWYESSTNGTWILQDDSKQLDFHARLTLRCQTVTPQSVTKMSSSASSRACSATNDVLYWHKPCQSPNIMDGWQPHS